ncbi:hypothetical protein [Streptomyces sp. NPDC005374]|uniref:hypothetical protein n=1 Tax=Streptomyces sp. NPDC005374 TaxID=3364713 RepID=UPI00368ADAC4
MGDDTSTRTGHKESAADGITTVELIVIPDPELDPEQAERAARRLRAEISGLDIESIGHGPAAPVPDRAKAGDAVTIGAIVVALSAAGGVFPTLIDTVRDWLGRSAVRHRVSVTIDGDTIELDRASDAERRALIDAYIRRHTDG